MTIIVKTVADYVDLNTKLLNFLGYYDVYVAERLDVYARHADYGGSRGSVPFFIYSDMYTLKLMKAHRVWVDMRYSEEYEVRWMVEGKGWGIDTLYVPFNEHPDKDVAYNYAVSLAVYTKLMRKDGRDV